MNDEPLQSWLEARGLSELGQTFLVSVVGLAALYMLWLWVGHLREPLDEPSTWSERVRERQKRFMSNYAVPVLVLAMALLVMAL